MLHEELKENLAALPFRFTQHQPGLLMRTLVSNDAYLVVLINKNPELVALELITPAGYQMEILSPNDREKITAECQIRLAPEETFLTKWTKDMGTSQGQPL